MRLLHARADHAVARPAEGEPGPGRGPGALRPRGQPVPVHRVPEHRQGGPGGRRADAVGGSAGRCAARARHREHALGGVAVMTAVAEPEVGRARRRKEDARLITGRTRWTDNLTLPGMLHMALLRGPVAHARITSIDADAARKMPGVLAVVTGADIAEEQGSLPCAWPITEDMKAPEAPAMAVGEVNFAGEVVAAVVARSAAEAVDALEAIDVEYDELPVVLDMSEAVADGDDLVPPEQGTNKPATWVYDAAEAGSGGAIDDALAQADVVLERTFRQQRLIPAFMEPRSVLVDPTGEQITVWSATQIPHILKWMISAVTGVPETKVRVIAPDVGGGFGGKLQVTPEEIITFLLARKLGKPVKWTES